MDIFDLCDCLEDDSIDMILCDLPYGITACEWDTVIPLDDMWECFKRVIKPRGAIVLTASGKFTYQLAMSNFEWFKYEWVWDKGHITQPFSAYNRPLPQHESILIFADGQTTYNPQMTKGKAYNMRGVGSSEVWGKRHTKVNYGAERFPTTLLSLHKSTFASKQHPTQKPVALFEYLIRTYTQPGETVFDPCVGSGTTALAARNTGRNYIVGDSSDEYVQIARNRLALPYTLPMFTETHTEPKPAQMALEL